VINPVADQNADKPYSPKQTCGQCHDYENITQGYHFTQGPDVWQTAEQSGPCVFMLCSTPRANAAENHAHIHSAPEH
jgi:hypothetical protein